VSNELRYIRPLEGALLGTLFLAAGLMILFIALGWIRVDPASIHAPRWVLGVGAVLVGLFTVWGLVYGVRQIFGRRP